MFIFVGDNIIKSGKPASPELPGECDVKYFSISDMALALKTVGAVVGRAGFANVKAVGDLTAVA